jgi:signal transduction histidine kinase
VVFDITERRREQDALRDSERRLATQDVISRVLTRATSLQEGCEELLRVLCEAEGWDCGAVWQIDPAGESLRCAACWHREDSDQLINFTAGNRKTSFVRGTGALGRVWQTRAPLWIPDIETDPQFQRTHAALAAGLRGVLVFPIVEGLTVSGAIELYACRNLSERPPPCQLLDGVSSLIHNFMVRVRAETALRQLNAELEERVARRTREQEQANRELEAFSYSVSHDLRAPLRAMIGYSQILLEDYGPSLPSEALRLLQTIGHSGKRMGALIDDLLSLARLGRKELKLRHVEMRELVDSVLEESRFEGRDRANLVVHPLPPCYGDVQLLRQVWVNLLSNAFKYAQARDPIQIEIGSERGSSSDPIYFVRDNGAGFDMRYADKLFGVFQRLHGSEEFEGTGVGLAIVQRIVQRHGGRVWGEGAVDAGAKFAFSLPASSERGAVDGARLSHIGDVNP